MKKVSLMIALSAVLISCGNVPVEQPTASGLLPSKFVSVYDGDTTNLYVMKNATGMEVCVTNIGGRIVSVMVPDKAGAMQDVVLGFDNIESYKDFGTNFGAIIGRYGNRIAGGKFTIDSTEYTLAQNNGNNSLHGGTQGFHTRYFKIEQPDAQSLVCSYTAKDMEEGFPGNLLVKVTYTLTDDNAIDIVYEAITDKTTHVNLTNHSYFNLSGDPNRTIEDHILYLACDNYTPTDESLITTGSIEPVSETPLDFTSPFVVGERINDTSFIAIKYGNGYDHNFVINTPGEVSTPVAKVICPETGISMEVYTSEPGIQLYTGNFLDGSNIGKKGISYNFRTAFCLETQHFPDSPNKVDFPSTLLYPETIYSSRCTYKFGVEK
ncbi:MAG: galactose mutarotase [Prevotellaceae bacterium]|jgi:aldose 1-epimerase|nr:galactose mutarotase [Prevotellaceae bacterium]